jgi:hypothetical protein
MGNRLVAWHRQLAAHTPPRLQVKRVRARSSLNHVGFICYLLDAHAD